MLKNKIKDKKTFCKKFMIDKDLPVITANANDINVMQKESRDIESFLTITYGISGGNFSCDIDNTDKLFVGTHVVNCIATGNNGLSVNKELKITVEKFYIDYDIKIIWDKDTFALPGDIEITLNSNVGPIYSFMTEDKSDNNTGEYIVTVENVPMFDDNNNLFHYYLTGKKYLDGLSEYTPVAISNNEIKINYKYNLPPPQTTIKVMAIFENLDILPESIDLNLLRNGVVYKNVVLNDNNNWNYTESNIGNYNDYSIDILNIDGLGNYDYFITKNNDKILITVISYEDIDDEEPPI